MLVEGVRRGNAEGAKDTRRQQGIQRESLNTKDSRILRLFAYPRRTAIFTRMKHIFLIFILALTIVSCNKSEHANHEAHDMEATEGDSTNTILYNQVMDIHDEVMPKTEDLYNKKKDLQKQLETASGDQKAALEKKIAQLDSANNMMMTWMHEFNPPADTADQEQTRAYLESEMVKIKRVKEGIEEALKIQ